MTGKPGDDWESQPPRGLFSLLPRKTMIKGVWLWLMLAGVFWFQARTSSCARTITDQVTPPARRVAPPPATRQDTPPAPPQTPSAP